MVEFNQFGAERGRQASFLSSDNVLSMHNGKDPWPGKTVEECVRILRDRYPGSNPRLASPFEDSPNHTSDVFVTAPNGGSIVLTWQEAKYLASIDTISLEDLQREKYPTEWPR